MTIEKKLKVVVFWLNFGPYHVARLQELATVVDLTAIELVRGTTHHEWHLQNKETVGFRWESLYHDVQYHQIDRADYRQRMDWCLANIDPDVIVIPGYSPYFPRYLMKWAKQHRKISILMIDSTKTDKKRYWPLELVKRFQLRYFHAAVVAGSACRDYMHYLGMPMASMFTGYDVVDNDYFQSGAEDARAQSEVFRQKFQLPKTYFLIVARLIHQKNFEHILAGYRRYHSKTSNPWPLVICGDGEDRAWIEPTIVDMPDIRLHRFIQIEELVYYYGLASALVLLSRFETWGLVVNEAMSAGLPLILCRQVACWHDLLQPGKNGILVDDFQDETAIAQAFQDMTDMPKTARLEMGQVSRGIISNWQLSRFREAVMGAIAYASR